MQPTKWGNMSCIVHCEKELHCCQNCLFVAGVALSCIDDVAAIFVTEALG